MPGAMERASPHRFHASNRRKSSAVVAPIPAIDTLGWKCPAAQALRSGGPAADICVHWAEKTCTLAEQHVQEAFSKMKDRLISIAHRPPSGSIPMVLALAGSDTEDHEATMRLAEVLFRETISTASTARIHPSELRSLTYANRKIMEKLRNPDSTSTSSNADASSQEDPDVEEEDEEPNEEFPSFNFSEALQRGKDGRIPLTVLLFQGMDAAPKDVLRQVLCFWHAQCLENGAPLLIFLGLKQLPPSRQFLFDLEEDEQLPFVHVDTVQLLDSTKVCEQLLDCLIEDCSCPLTMCPDILKRLREIYCFQRQSVSHILQALFLLFDDAMAESAISGFGAPLLWLCNDGNDAPPGMVRTHFQNEFRRRAKAMCSQEVAKQFQHLWPDEGRSSAPLRMADAAAEAMEWRCSLVASLPLYEVLMNGAWSTAKFYERLRRIHPFLEVVWPVPASEEVKQRKGLDDHFRAMQDLLDCLQVKHLQRLLYAIRQVSPSCVSKALAQELQALLKQADDLGDAASEKGTDERQTLKQLRLSFRSWVEKVRSQYWQPLRGRARDVFLAKGSLNCSKDSLDMAEKSLSTKFEVRLQHLAASVPIENAETDRTRLYQILECTSGRQVKVAELWYTFTQLVSDFGAEVMKAPKSKGGEKEKELQGLKKRFQIAALALHHVGLFAPAAGSAQKGLSGWRLKKRFFGRVWLRDPQEELRRAQDVTLEKLCKAPEAMKLISPKRIREKSAPPPQLAVPEPLAPGNEALKRLPHGRRYADKNDDLYTPQKKRKKEKIYFG